MNETTEELIEEELMEQKEPMEQEKLMEQKEPMEQTESNKNNSVSCIMMQIVKTTKQKALEFKENKLKQKEAFLKNQQKTEDELMKNLTLKYYQQIIDNMIKASELGSSKMIMHFDYAKFYANYPGLGNPCQVAIRWSAFLTLPQNEEKIKKYLNNFSHLNGLRFYVKPKAQISKMVIHYNWNDLIEESN